MSPRLTFLDILPRPELAQYVRLYHLRHFVFERDFIPPVKPYPPRPEQTLMFYPRDSGIVEYTNENKIIKRPRAVLCGQQLSRLNLCVSNDFIGIIVVFNPGALYHVIHTPLHLFAGSDVDLEDVIPGTRALNARLSSCESYDEMIAMIENFLVETIRMKKQMNNRIPNVAELIFRRPEHLNLDWLASEACLSTKQFNRKFQDYVGVSPKTFMRISRLYKTYNMHFRYPEKDWLTIALECGYQDYQHMAKDYKAFANTTPVALFNEDQSASERIFGQREPGDHPEI